MIVPKPEFDKTGGPESDSSIRTDGKGVAVHASSGPVYPTGPPQVLKDAMPSLKSIDALGPLQSGSVLRSRDPSRQPSPATSRVGWL